MKGILVIPAIIALTGCAGMQLPALPEAPQSLTPATSESVLKGSSNSYQKIISYDVPSRYCNASVYIKGVEYGYITSWNQLIADKTMLYTLMYQNNSGDSKAEYNYKLYSNKKLLSDAVNSYEADYGTYGQNEKGGLDFCDSGSFTAGKGEGIRFARSDYKKLQGQERK